MNNTKVIQLLDEIENIVKIANSTFSDETELTIVQRKLSEAKQLLQEPIQRVEEMATSKCCNAKVKIVPAQYIGDFSKNFCAECGMKCEIINKLQEPQPTGKDIKSEEVRLIDANELMRRVLDMNNTYTNGNAQWGEYYTELLETWIDEAKTIYPTQQSQQGKVSEISDEMIETKALQIAHKYFESQAIVSDFEDAALDMGKWARDCMQQHKASQQEQGYTRGLVEYERWRGSLNALAIHDLTEHELVNRYIDSIPPSQQTTKPDVIKSVCDHDYKDFGHGQVYVCEKCNNWKWGD